MFLIVDAATKAATTTSEVPDMCRPVSCDACQKVTWAGCGQHVEQVMSHVPAARQCTCR